MFCFVLFILFNLILFFLFLFCYFIHEQLFTKCLSLTLSFESSVPVSTICLYTTAVLFRDSVAGCFRWWFDMLKCFRWRQTLLQPECFKHTDTETTDKSTNSNVNVQKYTTNSFVWFLFYFSLYRYHLMIIYFSWIDLFLWAHHYISWMSWNCPPDNLCFSPSSVSVLWDWFSQMFYFSCCLAVCSHVISIMFVGFPEDDDKTLVDYTFKKNSVVHTWTWTADVF